jgi:hypothetical protein
MEEKRVDIETRRKTLDERASLVAWTEIVRTRLAQSAVARDFAYEGMGNMLHRIRIRRRTANNRRLLLPVTILVRPRFGWRFRAITGEIFFARNGLRWAGSARSVGSRMPEWAHVPLGASSGRFPGPNAGKSAGPKSPAPESQEIDFIEYFGMKKFSKKAREIPLPPAEFILRPRFARTGRPGTSPASGKRIEDAHA